MEYFINFHSTRLEHPSQGGDITASHHTADWQRLLGAHIVLNAHHEMPVPYENGTDRKSE